MAAILNKNKDLTLGAGLILFARKNSDGSYDGFRAIKETPDFTISVETQVLTLMGSDTAVAQKIAEDEISRDMTSTITTHTIDDDNLYLFFAADDEEIVQEAAAIADEELGPVKQGRTYRLGVSPTNKRGVRGLSNVAVTEDEEITPDVYVEGEDYEVDLRRGTITILEGGDIEDGDTILVSYDAADVGMRVGKTQGRKSVEGMILFEADNTRGENRDYEMRNVMIRPQGDVSLKSREAYQQLTYQVSILEDEDGVALYLEGEPYDIEVEV